MKKFIAFILCLCISLFSTACTFSPSVNLVMDDIQPWAIGQKNVEECIYSVVKKDKNGVILGKGQLATTATVNGDKTTIDCNFYFSETEGVIDTITSSATIINSTCAAISSRKEVKLQSNPSLNYKFEADYETKKVTYYTSSGTKTIDVSESVVLDNESLYYVIRAFNPTDDKEGQFLLTNLYECYLNDRIASYSVYYHAVDALLSKDNFTDIIENDTWETLTNNNQIVDNKVDCYYVKVNRNETGRTGAPLELWFSKKAFNGGKGRVLLKMTNSTLSFTTTEVESTIEYELVSYNISTK